MIVYEVIRWDAPDGAAPVEALFSDLALAVAYIGQNPLLSARARRVDERVGDGYVLRYRASGETPDLPRVDVEFVLRGELGDDDACVRGWPGEFVRVRAATPGEALAAYRSAFEAPAGEGGDL